MSDEQQQQEEDLEEFLYKILVVGDFGTGKTSFIKRYVHDTFSLQYKSTIGVDFAMKVIREADYVIRMQLWDIAGQERFGTMTRVYYKEAVGAFVVFDVTRGSTFEAVMRWKNDIDNKVFLPNGDQVPCVLLANKCDLQQDSAIDLSEEYMYEFCDENGFVGWFQASAKEGTNIEEAANTLLMEVMKVTDSQFTKDGKTVSLIDVAKGEEEGCWC